MDTNDCALLAKYFTVLAVNRNWRDSTNRASAWSNYLEFIANTSIG